MPNRILKQSICSSENVDALSVEAETFFYRLIVQCDDYGRMDARVPILRAACFPLRLDRVTDKQVCAWVAELQAAGLIETYSVKGHPYLHFVKWDSHQQIRAKRSKYPQPSESDVTDVDVQSNDFNGNHVQANVPVIQSNPIQSESNMTPKSGAAKAATPARDDLFDAIVEVCAVDPGSAGPSIGKVKQALLKCAPPYTAAEVRAFGVDWWSWSERSKAPSLWKLQEQIGNVRSKRPAGNGAAAELRSMGYVGPDGKPV